MYQPATDAETIRSKLARHEDNIDALDDNTLDELAQAITSTLAGRARDRARDRLKAIYERAMLARLDALGWAGGAHFETLGFTQTTRLKAIGEHFIFGARVKSNVTTVTCVSHRDSSLSFAYELGDAKGLSELEVMCEALDVRFGAAGAGLKERMCELELERRRRWLIERAIPAHLARGASIGALLHTLEAQIGVGEQEHYSSLLPPGHRARERWDTRTIRTMLDSRGQGYVALISLGGSFREEGSEIFASTMKFTSRLAAKQLAASFITRPFAHFKLSARWARFCSGKRWCEIYPFDF